MLVSDPRGDVQARRRGSWFAPSLDITDVEAIHRAGRVEVRIGFADLRGLGRGRQRFVQHFMLTGDRSRAFRFTRSPDGGAPVSILVVAPLLHDGSRAEECVGGTVASDTVADVVVLSVPASCLTTTGEPSTFHLATAGGPARARRPATDGVEIPRPLRLR